jgi:hypothetical protein
MVMAFRLQEFWQRIAQAGAHCLTPVIADKTPRLTFGLEKIEDHCNSSKRCNTLGLTSQDHPAQSKILLIDKLLLYIGERTFYLHESIVSGHLSHRLIASRSDSCLQGIYLF